MYVFGLFRVLVVGRSDNVVCILRLEIGSLQHIISAQPEGSSARQNENYCVLYSETDAGNRNRVKTKKLINFISSSKEQPIDWKKSIEFPFSRGMADEANSSNKQQQQKIVDR